MTANQGYAIKRLTALEAAYSAPEDESDLAFYKGFLDANLYEVALHVLCDHLIEHAPRSLTPEVIANIAELHSLMGLQDDCVSALNKKLDGRTH